MCSAAYTRQLIVKEKRLSNIAINNIKKRRRGLDIPILPRPIKTPNLKLKKQK